IEHLSNASEAAKVGFPDLAKYEPEKALVIRADTGEIYRAAEATVICLWACREYRGLALRLANPMLLPLARKIYPLIARNRHALSKLLIDDRKLKRKLEKQGDQCDDGSCELE
ncbi:MAG: DCC1-like thiol-disulfide oxidoreductase family protein, partial [Rubritalea sp.]|uniref:DCC1-like thiol-disulfide oxidoreductase family protein n=1 Tax=Rubritalea sp. TaxID=2109375 RepID=UPI003242219F